MLVQINLDLYGYYDHQIPTYRIWVDGVLYLEREYWIDWVMNYIEEEIYVDIEPGEHEVFIEKIRPPTKTALWVEEVLISYEGKNKRMSFDTNPQDKQTIKFVID